MLITYYEDGSSAPKRTSKGMVLLMGANLLFAGVILFAWTYIAFFLAEPIAWATWMPIHRGYGLSGIMEYPFVLLWLFPLVGVFGAWVSLKGGKKTFAYACVAVPLVIFVLVMTWYHLTPSDWH